MISLFVTGTDTGVGKTLVATGLLRRARHLGLRVAALKPAETGCRKDERGALLPADGLALRAAAGLEDLPIERVVPFRYELPVAPAVAARREGHRFSLDEVLAASRSWGDVDLLVIEGAGGLLVPFTDELLAADLAIALQARLVIVGRAGLGTINHTLLTIFEARRRGLHLAGVVLNHAQKTDDASVADNAAEISRIGQVRVLGPLPFGADDRAFAALDPLLSPEPEVANE